MKRLSAGCLILASALSRAAEPPTLHMFVLEPVDSGETLRTANASPPIPELHMTVLPQGQGVARTAEAKTPAYRFSYSLGLGWRRDRLDWTVRGANGPLTREKWRDLDSLRLAGTTHIVTPIRLTFQGRLAYSWVLNGKQRRTDYLGDLHNRPFSRIAADGDGHFLDLSAGFGYRIPLWDGGFHSWLEPLAGYAYREAALSTTDPRQVVVTPGLTPSTGALPSAEYRYRARWHGPWLGLQLGMAGERWQVYGQGEYHFAFYRADGRWKRLGGSRRRIEFGHDSDGFGVVAEVGGRYRFLDALSLRLSFDFQRWESDSGRDATKLDGGKIGSRLDGAAWRSFGGSLGLSYDF